MTPRPEDDLHAAQGAGPAAPRPLARFLFEERGDTAAGTYLFTLMIAMWFIFFAIDLGLRKGAQLSVEYAAYCAARAAAVRLNTYSAGKVTCDAAAAKTAATRAAAACLSGVVSKRGVPDPTSSGAISLLIDRAQQQLTVTLSDACTKADAVTADVSFTYKLRIPMSPLSGSSTATVMYARAQHLIY